MFELSHIDDDLAGYSIFDICRANIYELYRNLFEKELSNLVINNGKRSKLVCAVHALAYARYL